MRCIDAVSSGRPELRQRLLAGILLTGEAGGLRGLQGLVERRVGALVAALPYQGSRLAAVQVGVSHTWSERIGLGVGS